jgi:hypothetical protein
MGIQVFQQLKIQRAYAVGELHKLRRAGAPEADLLEAQRLLDSLDFVMAHQGVADPYDRDHAVERRPKRSYFPIGAYRRDVLNILREEGRPMRIREILEKLCVMHHVTLSEDERRHAAIKLAQGNDVLIAAGFVTRWRKEGEHRSSPCWYMLRERP